MKKLICLAMVLLAAAGARAQMSAGPWTPLYKGIALAMGTNWPGAGSPISAQQAVQCVRVDLSDPDVQIFTTPPAPNYTNDTRETLSLSVSNFLQSYKLKVACDGNFFDVFKPGGGTTTDATLEGLPARADGLLISTSFVVSAGDTVRSWSLLFTTNKQPSLLFVTNNTAQAASIAGIYNAVTGFYPLLTNGVNLWLLYSNQLAAVFLDDKIHQLQPRTALGYSQDKRYLFLLTIDGRQDTQDYSDGAFDSDIGRWLLAFGAWNAINMDGGGSTAMYRADCAGYPVAVNHSSYIGSYGRERFIGAHFGVKAKPLPGFINDVNGAGGSTTATITWTTLSNTTSQVEYGLTSAYGTLFPPTADVTLTTNHSVTLSGLLPGNNYFFRVISSTIDGQWTWDACGLLTTTNASAYSGLLFDLTNVWNYYHLSLDATPAWKTNTFNDSAWDNGSGVMWADLNGSPNAALAALFLDNPGTGMPTDPNNSDYPYRTYYFRTRFNFTNALAGATLTFSNYIDDGAVFYLNGVEINRLFIPTNATFTTLATNYYCTGGNATCPYVFTLSSNQLSRLVQGTNVLAVEVHNYSATSPDITFGSALFFTAMPYVPPSFINNVNVTAGETNATISWTTLSNATTQLQFGTNSFMGTWTPLYPTPVTNHAITLTGLDPLTKYYFEIASQFGATTFTAAGSFTTTAYAQTVLGLTGSWRYNTNNLSATNWFARAYNDSTWPGPSNALLYIENSTLVSPRNSPVPPASGSPFLCYYFRTSFVWTNDPTGLALIFSNYVDDGAVFYLNGKEINRLRMPEPPAVITYTNLATGQPISGDAVYPDVFRISGGLLRTNLVMGTNVVAVEVHQTASSSDIVFGSEIVFVRALASETPLHIVKTNAQPCLYWDGLGMVLQRSTNVANPNAWSDHPGPVKYGPFWLTNPPTPAFYRLRN